MADVFVEGQLAVRQHKTKRRPAVGMHGFGHDKGNKVYTGLHSGSGLGWVVGTYVQSAWAGAAREQDPPQPSFGGLWRSQKLETGSRCCGS